MLAPCADATARRFPSHHRARIEGGGRQLDRVASANRPALDDLRPETRVKQSLQRPLSAEESDEVLARLAMLFALSLDLADAKAATDEVGEVNVPDVHLTSRLSGPKGDPMLGLQLFERLRFDQRDVARLGVVEVAVPFEASAGVCHNRRHLMRQDAHGPGEKNRFDVAFLLAHVSPRIVCPHEVGPPLSCATVAMTSRWAPAKTTSARPAK
jgi:hypothetical protein